MPPLSSGPDDTVLGDRNLRWGHNSRGVVYQFNRGVLMYSKTGDKCLKVIPSSDTTTHHADLMYQIATERSVFPFEVVLWRRAILVPQCNAILR